MGLKLILVGLTKQEVSLQTGEYVLLRQTSYKDYLELKSDKR